MEAFDFMQLLQEIKQCSSAIQIDAVFCRILCNHHQLPDTALRQLFRLFHQLLDGKGHIIPANQRNRTIGTVIAAALGNFQICRPRLAGHLPLTFVIAYQIMPVQQLW